MTQSCNKKVLYRCLPLQSYSVIASHLVILIITVYNYYDYSIGWLESVLNYFVIIKEQVYFYFRELRTLELEVELFSASILVHVP